MNARLKAYCELVRLPNVFTTAGDILAGYWLAGGTMGLTWRLGCVLAASGALYSAGIAFNDIADIATDRNERPGRPLPSGRIAILHAWRLAVGLTIVGMVLALAAGRPGEPAGPLFPWMNETALVAACLVLAILLYDLLLKDTPLGPLLMGACRALNIVLGMSAAAPLTSSLPPHVLAPVAMFVYIASVTWFGRQEAGVSRAARLASGLAGIVFALLLQGLYISWSLAESWFTLVLWLAFLIQVVRVCWRAVRRPDAPQVQYAMKTMILGLIVFDAIFAAGAHGWQGGVVVLALLIPTLVIGRWVYST